MAGLHAASRLALRLRCAVVLMDVLVAAWLLVGLRLYLLPPAGGLAPEVLDLHALGAGINAVLLGYLALWVWRAERWATVVAVLTLVVNALLIIQPPLLAGHHLVLALTLSAGVAATSLLISPQRPPQY